VDEFLMTGDTFDKIKKGVKETAEGVKEGAEKVTDSYLYGLRRRKGKKRL
jgi:hypothetical protein